MSLPVPVCEHRWDDLSPAEAAALQRAWRERVIEQDRLAAPLRTVAGVDASYDRGSPVVHGAAVLCDAVTGELLEVQGARLGSAFPYVPGLLAWREIPVLLSALAKLTRLPDLILCDGHGRAHPRRFGLACHLGVLVDRTAIGCAKTRFVGTGREPGRRRGSAQPLCDGGEIVGLSLRTRTGVRPVYVSVGHRVSLETAQRLVLELAPRYRLPEPLRAAHHESNRLRAATAAD